MKSTYLYFSLAFLLLFLACKNDDENFSGTGIVNFTLEELVEVENTTSALAVNIGVDSFNHSGGTISVSISGGNYGTDYETNTGSANFDLEIAPGGLISNFTLQPIDDETIEGNTVLTITLTQASGALQLGETTTLLFTILDDDNPLIAIISFENTASTIQENDAASTTINIPFDQESTNGGTITVEATGDAVFGTDYSITGETTSTFTINVPAGATNASFDSIFFLFFFFFLELFFSEEATRQR